MKIIEPVVSLEWITPDALVHIERAGRTAYKSEDLITPTSNIAFVDKINTLGHHSVLEHAVASLRFVTDRGISHEIVRHRIASYTQESTRYVNYAKAKHGGGDIKFILPLGLTPDQMEFAIHAFEVEEALYSEAIIMGFTPQQARDFLPTGVKTELVMTANFREYSHFLTLRTNGRAHPKMRVVAQMAANILADACPAVFGKFRS